jgi:hypothetical protein
VNPPTFQLTDTAIPNVVQINSLLSLQQGEYNFLTPTNQAGMMITDALSGYDPADATSPDGKTNTASGLVGDSLTQVQQMILEYGAGPQLGNFATATIPDEILAAIKANPGPSAMWNASNAQAGIVSVAGVSPLLPTVSAVDIRSGKAVRIDNLLLLP